MLTFVLMVQKPKRPRDTNELAKFITDLATNQAQEPDIYKGKNPAAVELGRLGGLKGGQARAKKLTTEEAERDC